MKRMKFAQFATCLLMCVAVICFSCKTDDDDYGSVTDIKKVTSVSLTPSATLKLIVGTTCTFNATVQPADAADPVLVWTVSATPEGCVTLSGGVLTAVAVGTATVTAAARDGSGKSASCEVTVEDSTVQAETLWRADAYDVTTATTGDPLGGITPTAGLAIDSDEKINGSYTFGKKINLSGSGSLTAKNLSFAVTGNTTVTVYALSGGSSEARTLVLASSDGAVIGTASAPINTYSVDGNTVPALAYPYTGGADTLYLYSQKSGINIYAVHIAGESDSTVTLVLPDSLTLSDDSLSFDLDTDETVKTLTATLSPDNITSGYNKVNWTSSNPAVAIVDSGVVTARSAGTAVITASTESGGCMATCTVTVTGVPDTAIRASDAPTGWASYTRSTDLAGNAVTPPDAIKGTAGGCGASSVTVSTRTELQAALKGTAKKIIYIDGMIDMTDGMLPEKANGTTAALDAWIKEKTTALGYACADFAAYKTWYASGNTNTADESGVYQTVRSSLSNDWGSLIKLTVPSNTTIIGLTTQSGIKGGSIQLNEVTNVVIRNLFIQDPFDPFPQIEKGDGFNANWDAIQIQGGCTYIWIDHCTLQDTIAVSDEDFDHRMLSDGVDQKYQVFDGLCDIKQASDFITVSYCKFMNHDKTMLIGHDKKYTDDENHQTITLHHNYFLNCVQRLPMVRFATIHIYNNYYAMDTTARRTHSYAIGLREENKAYVENNYFGSGIKNATSTNDGSYYLTGNYGLSDAKSIVWNPSVYYTYTADAAAGLSSSIPASAGAGVLPVVQ